MVIGESGGFKLVSFKNNEMKVFKNGKHISWQFLKAFSVGIYEILREKYEEMKNGSDSQKS